ncbi:MlaD family protein [Nocardia blacklockiae]|uniref:MlaD family protein n=1 Tax=Nocardia blacklockiae TaxID=480036 RepID=UPI0018963816|nr:MlaD family protein [Nocardia blacklockiae]MBF6171897.1 MCE family protein [Nocardia blacklockiae]
MSVRSTVSLAAIAAVLVLGITYMTVGVLHLDPRRSHLTAEMRLADSGGLGPNAPVLLRGLQVGRTREVRKQATGVLVRLEIDDRYRIPIASTVVIEQLSALGEPYIEFEPADGGGPYLRDGQLVPTDRIRTPMTITALSARLVELMNQIHPEVMGRLVDTFGRALSGTDTTMRTLQRSTTLLATTLLSRTPALRQLFADIQAMGGDIDWLGPSLAAAGPEFGEFGRFLNRIVEQGSGLVDARPTADYFTGDGVVPFLDSTTALLDKIGPGLAPLGPVLRPVVADAVRRTPEIDVSTLIDQALNSVDADGTLRFRISVK